jgi:hypothetical protein
MPTPRPRPGIFTAFLEHRTKHLAGTRGEDWLDKALIGIGIGTLLLHVSDTGKIPGTSD